MKRPGRRAGATNPGLVIIFSLVVAAVFLASPLERSYAQTAVNSPPTFEAFTNNITVAEDTPVGSNIGDPLAATDPDGDSLYFALTNGHTDLFSINNRTGQLRTRAVLDYETKPEEDYWVHVGVRDGRGPGGQQDLVADDVALIVLEVENADEPGTVTLNWSQPQVGGALAATLEDPDGETSGMNWRWAQSATRNGAYTDISGATSATYTPVAGDANRYLRVTVTYTDPEGSGKTAQATSGPVRAAPQNDNAPVFAEGETATRSVTENAPANTNVGSRLRATNTDNQELRYSLDDDHFSIDPKTGQIRTKTSPDYETAISHSVVVTVTDPFGDSDTIEVTINVINQPVEILGPSQVDYSEDPFYRTEPVAQYTLVPSSATPTLTGTDARLFSFDTYGSLAFKEDPDYEAPKDSGRNNVYNVTLNAVDGTHRTTRNVSVRVTNHNEGPIVTGPSAPKFTEQTTGAVARYTAKDPENDPIRWSVQDTDDWAYFKISQSGVLAFREPPDFETRAKDAYEVVVLAQSGMNMATDGMRIDVTVVDGADPPFFHRGYSEPLTVSENAGRDTPVGDPVSATGAGSLTYTLKGADARHFALDSATGQLKTKSALNYEARNSYSVTVRASDGSLATDAPVTISVINEDEAGTVTLSTGSPRARTALTARLSDPDGGVTDVTWQWASSTDQVNWTDIFGATSQTFSPEDYEVGRRLQATASYTDRQGPGKTAQAQSSNAVRAGANRSPSSLDPGTTISRTVDENTEADTDIGAPVTTTDPDGDTLTYSLAGRDASSFSIVADTGQLKTRAALNYERKNSYTLVVRARDPSNSYANLTVNITVRNVDEPGRVTLSTSQPRVGAAVTATLADPDGGVTGVTWRWVSADSATGTGQDINGATSRSYTPDAAYQGKHLRAVATYTDSIGANKTAQSQPLLIVAANTPRTTGQGNNGNNGNNGGNPGLSGRGAGSGQDGTQVTQDQSVTVSYGAANYSVNEGSSVRVTVRLSSAAPQPLRLPVSISRGSAENGDYRVHGLNGGRLSFSQGSRTASFIVAALQDADTDNERLNLRFGSLLTGYSTGSIAAAAITIIDDDRSRITVNYGASRHSVNEGSSVQVTVRLSSAAPRSLAVPITVSRGSAESGDYRVSGLSGGGLRFNQGHRSSTFTITALQDDDADNETLNLGLGALPQGIYAGPTSTATVTINDDEVPPPLQLSVAYQSAKYAVLEGQSISISVRLSANPGRELHIPITLATDPGMEAHYQVSGLNYGDLRFAHGDTSASFTFAALQDDDTTDEQVRLGFGPLPANVVLGSRNRSILTIQDDDLTETLTREVNAPPAFTDGEQANQSVAEQAAPNTPAGLPVTATDPDGDVLTYGIGGADAAKFSLDSQTGQLRVKGRLDLEVQPSFQLALSVSDGRGGTDHINVQVNLTDIAEVPVTNRSTQAVGLYAPGKPFYLETPAGAAAISLPEDFSPTPVFVRIESAAANCVGQWPAGDGRAYVTVQFFDTWGNPVEDLNLQKAVATLRFDSQALGGAEAANAAYQRDGIRVYQYRKPEEDWARKQFSLAMDESGGLALTVGGLNGLTCLAAFTHAVAPNQTAPAASSTPEPQGTTRKPRNPTADRDLWYPESTPAPMGVADSGSNGDSPGGVGGPGGPLGVAQAAVGGDAAWWPRLSLLLGVPLLLGAVGWQVALFLRDRRRRSRTFTRPRSRYFWQ
ncbi:MAG: cadherin repeat domain-containing protein [Chloroflexi bacterium]|nr:cadherin repeat domain-containing protein [Chloroflexota bacterium]